MKGRWLIPALACFSGSLNFKKSWRFLINHVAVRIWDIDFWYRWYCMQNIRKQLSEILQVFFANARAPCNNTQTGLPECIVMYGDVIIFEAFFLGKLTNVKEIARFLAYFSRHGTTYTLVKTIRQYKITDNIYSSWQK